MDTPIPPLTSAQSEDFQSKYANHVQFELSPWDLKMTFGQVDAKLGVNAVMQHTAITVPWPQAKVMLYMLQTNLAIFEKLAGRVSVPGGIIPKPEAVVPGLDDDEFLHELVRHYDEFIKANPEAVAPGLSTTKTKRK